MEIQVGEGGKRQVCTALQTETLHKVQVDQRHFCAGAGGGSNPPASGALALWVSVYLTVSLPTPYTLQGTLE